MSVGLQWGRGQGGMLPESTQHQEGPEWGPCIGVTWVGRGRCSKEAVVSPHLPTQISDPKSCSGM